MGSLHLKISLGMAAAIALSVALFLLLTWFKVETMLEQLAGTGDPDRVAAAELAGDRIRNAMLDFALPCIGGLMLPAWIGCRLIFQPLRRILAEAERALDAMAEPRSPPGLAGELEAFGVHLRQAAGRAEDKTR